MRSCSETAMQFTYMRGLALNGNKSAEKWAKQLSNMCAKNRKQKVKLGYGFCTIGGHGRNASLNGICDICKSCK